MVGHQRTDLLLVGLPQGQLARRQLPSRLSRRAPVPRRDGDVALPEQQLAGEIARIERDPALSAQSSRAAVRAAVEKRYTLVPTICFNCESACGILAYVDKETLDVRKIEGNPVHPGSRGRTCAKGSA